jgi:hypothetical protein
MIDNNFIIRKNKINTIKYKKDINKKNNKK